MAGRRVPAAVVSRFFEGDETHLSEVFFEGSDDDLGMEAESTDSEEVETDGTIKNYYSTYFTKCYLNGVLYKIL